jgi:LDH2 family malate/lactate/ureidoglycolate dehydrogenase
MEAIRMKEGIPLNSNVVNDLKMLAEKFELSFGYSTF